MPYATDYTTLLSGSYWGGAEITGKPVFVTYSFDTTAPASDQNNLSPSAYATFTPFTAAQQAEARQALTEWSSSSTDTGGGSGVIFLEVPSGQGDINFASYDFSSDPNASGVGGLGFFPWGNWNYSTFGTNQGHFAADLAGSGNVLMNTAFESGGLFAYATMLHEIGHALGLKHPTDAWTDYVPGWINVPHNQWDPSVTYNSTFSIMSTGASSLSHPTSADWQAVQSIYGTPAQAADEDKTWSWNSSTWTLTQALKDDGETVRGVSTNNVITGGAGADNIYAIGAGTNVVFGGAGDDSLVGGSGSNTLDGGPGADTLNGWFGPTVASYQDATAGVSANLMSPWLNTGDAAGDVYLQISRLQGSNFADTLTADNNGDQLSGMGGNDTLVSGSGDDTLDGGPGTDAASYAAATAAVTVSLALQGAAQATGAGGSDTLTNIENLIGSNFADVLTGDGGNNSLAGGGGNDTLYGGLGDDTLDGGKGTNTASYSGASGPVSVNLSITTAQATGSAGSDTLKSIQNLVGSAFADSLTGDAHNNLLTGGAGNDSLYGGAGNDTLSGGTGDDSLDGGAGTDTATYADAASAVNVSLMMLGPQNTLGAGTDTLVNIENLTGSAFNDTLEGSAGNNAMDGGTGTNTVSYADATAAVSVSLALTSAQNTLGAGTDTLKNFTGLIGSAFDDVLTGGTKNDTISGGAGNDTITGGKGGDVLTGGPGADHFVYLATADSTTAVKGQDVITDFSSAQNDKIDLSAIDANTMVSGDQAFTWAGSSFTHVAGQLIELTKTGGFLVEGDVNGDAKADFGIFVDGSTALGAGDFIL
jgi:Ca2+-binding RTX toxin-like protein